MGAYKRNGSWMTGTDPNQFDRYLSGELLYGDDFTAAQMEQWYTDEKKAYANLGAKDASNYGYHYHALNRLHGFDHLPRRKFDKALGFGSAYGEELLPVISRLGTITIVDPSEAFKSDKIHGVRAIYKRPKLDGQLPIRDDEFDLICCFGVLHHIPNVSFVVSELARVLKPGGYLLIREPIVSMGDWRFLRPGLTKRERGIPVSILRRLSTASGLTLERWSLCDFSVTPHILGKFRRDVFNSPLLVLIDSLLSRAFAWNVNYHPRNNIQRFRPSSAFLILRKPSDKSDLD